MSSEVTLAFIDESESRRVVGLCALLVNAAQIEPVRVEVYRFLRALEGPPEDHLTRAPVLHGVEMLRDHAWATDEMRLRCFEFVVDLVSRWKLPFVRSAYHRRSLTKLQQQVAGQPRAYYLTLFGVHAMLEHWLARGLVMPVLDGWHNELVKAAGGGDFTLAMRARPERYSGALSIEHTENMLDPVFTVSELCIPLQLADVVAYLLSQRDERERIERDGSPFKKALLDIADRLRPTREEIIWMRFNGEPAPPGKHISRAFPIDDDPS